MTVDKRFVERIMEERRSLKALAASLKQAASDKELGIASAKSFKILAQVNSLLYGNRISGLLNSTVYDAKSFVEDLELLSKLLEAHNKRAPRASPEDIAEQKDWEQQLRYQRALQELSDAVWAMVRNWPES